MYKYHANVSHNGQHFCVVDFARNNRVSTQADAKTAFAVLCERFTAEDGFHLTLERTEISTRTIAYSAGA